MEGITPVLFIIFNRVNATQQVFEAIRLAQPSRLYISADAPRPGNSTDQEKCRLTRAVTEEIDWPCEVKRLFHDKNLGCGLAVSEAIKWFFDHESEGIILEDDCLPHPDFFVFASTMLERFRYDHQIISISGSSLGYKPASNKSYCYSRFMNMWGWATWKDRSDHIDYNMKDWNNKRFKDIWLYNHLRQSFFDFDLNWFKLWKMKFDKVSCDFNFTWDWQWIYYQIGNKKLTIVPASNLVSNIGFNMDATHTLNSSNPSSNIPTEPLSLPLIHPKVVKPDYSYEEHFVKWVWCYHKRLPTIFYLKQFVSRLIGRS